MAGRAFRRGGTLIVFLLVVVAILLAGLQARQERAIRGEWKVFLSAMADEQKAGVEAIVHQRLADAVVFASFPSVVALVRPGDAGLGGVEHLRSILEEGRVGWGSRSIAILGADLRPRVCVGEELPAAVAKVLPTEGAARSWTGLVEGSGGRRLIVAAPVPDGTDGQLGWIVLVEDPALGLWKALARDGFTSRTGESYIVGREDGGLVFLSPLRYFRKGERVAESALQSDTLTARHALDGPDGFGEYRDYRGERVLAAHRRIKGTGWGLVVKIDRSEAFAGLAKDRVWAAVTLVSFGLAFFAAFRAFRSGERLRTASELLRRDERYRVVLAQVRDSIVWIRPASGRIVEANRAAEELWGYSREELLAKTVFDLRPEEDREEARLRMATIRESGSLFRSRHRRKDGSVFPVEVSSQALVLDGEGVHVSVVRDVSEQEAAFQRIQFLNRVLRTISAVENVLVTERDRETVLRRTCEEIVATGTFAVAWYGVPGEGGRLVTAAFAGRVEGYFEEATILLDDSPRGRGPSGTAFREGRTVVVDDWETDPLVEPWREAGLRRGFRSSAACPVRRGGTICGVLTLYSLQPGAFAADAVLLLEELAGDLGIALELIEADEKGRKAEEALAASEARYRRLFEENPAPMWVFDVETLRFLAVNGAAVGLYGYSRAEFLSKTLREIRPPEDVVALEDDVLVPRTGVRKSGPWRHQRKDGSLILVEVVSHDVSFEGRHCRLILANDVTERLRAEDKLRAFFDSGMVGALFGDVHGNILAANDEFLRIVGYTRRELESGNLRWIDITPPEWLPLDAQRIAEAKERGVCTPYEKEFVRKDRLRVPVLVGYALVGDKREESVAFVIDLTDRKDAEKRLGATTNLLRAIVVGSPAPILTLARDGTVTSWNPAAETVFGWTAEETIGRRLPIVPPGDEGDFLSFVDEILSGRSSAGREVRRLRKDGSLVNVSVSAAPLFDDAGAVVGLAAVVSDVTARVRAEEEIRRLNAELEERVERRTDELMAKTKELEGFAYSVSHDLRAPLRAIDGFSRMVEEDYAAGLDDEGRRLVGVVRSNARRMGRLIDDLLAFSRAGRLDLRRAGIDMDELVQSVLGEVLPEAERERSDVRVGSLPSVRADPALLRQVFVNVLSNAVKFTSTRPRREIRVSGRREEGHVVYDVADNGVGFDMRYAGKLFGVFQRLHGREFEGTGVGLALVERILARHGGTIRAEAEQDRGATITISLPDEAEKT